MKILLIVLIGLVIAGGIGFAANSSNSRQTTSNPRPTSSPEELFEEYIDDSKSLQLATFPLAGGPPGYNCTANGKVAIELLIDTSGSMKQKIAGTNKSRMETVKDALIKFKANLKNDDIIGIRSFSGKGGKNNRNLLSPDKYSINKSTIDAAIAGLNAQGDTPTRLGVEQARKSILEGRIKYPDYNWTLILLSDGEPNPYETQDPRAIAKQMDQQDKIRIITIAFELNSKDIPLETARQVMIDTASSPGDFHEPDPLKLDDLYKDILQTVSSCTQAAAPSPAPTCTATTKPKINLLVDTSGSMDENIPTVRDVLKNFGNKLNSSDTIGFQDFSDGEPPRSSSARVKYPIGNYNQAQFNSAVGSLPADGENGLTAMRDGFEFAKVQIDENNSASDYKDWLLIFLSDGIPETKGKRPDPDQNPTSIANELKSKNIALASIALGTQSDKGLMRQLASSPNLYKEVSTVADLQKAYDEIFQSQACTPGS